MRSEQQAKLADQIFKNAARRIPTADQLGAEAIAEHLGAHAEDKEFIKQNFSALVSNVQIRAYEKYIEAEARECGRALKEVLEAHLPDTVSSKVFFDFLAENFPALDLLFLKLTQSRRPRAGRVFEFIVSTLFRRLQYPYTPQPTLGGSRPDYVLPSLEWYRRFAADCILFTCKRTLRERWRQVVTEGATGQSFFLATIDEKLSRQELENMKERRVIVVVPVQIKATHYSNALNVISFEDFFLHHLDSAMVRWRSQGALSS